MKKLIGILILIIANLSSVVFAQQAKLIVKAPDAVEIGERFQLTFTINKRGSNFYLPDIQNFDILSGPSVGQSFSRSIINGKVSSNTEYSYTYILSANKRGEFQIPSASISIDNKTIKSKPHKITVVKGKSQINVQNQGEVAKTDFFIRAFVNKKEVYVGEPIVVKIKLFSKNEFQFKDFKEPGYNGFWKREVEDISQNGKREAYNDQIYNAFLLQKSVLFPQKSGELTIDEATLDAIVRTYTVRNTQGQERLIYGNRKIKVPKDENLSVESPKVKIIVKDLPLHNKPKNFSNIVGESFEINAVISKNQLEIDDALNFKIMLKGRGNIDLIDFKNIQFPPDLETYDPKINQRSNANEYGVIGEKSFDYLLIPRTEGVFVIPQIKFSYFDIIDKEYKTLTTDSLTIIVGKGNSTKQPDFAAKSQKEIHQLATDIRYIKKDLERTYKKNFHIFNSLFFKIFVPISAFIAFLIILIVNKNKKQSKNISQIRNKRATKIALKKLKKANKLMNENLKQEFYLEISRALYGYLSDKLNLKNIDLSIDNVSEIIKNKGVSEGLSLKLKEVLTESELARFAPEENIIMNDIYNKSLNMIVEIEKEIKK